MSREIKNSKKVVRSILGGLAIFIIALGIGVWVWTSNTYAPTAELWTYVREKDYVKEGDFFVFRPQGEENNKGVVIYPGALVEPLSYAYYAKGLAEVGYLVGIPKVRLNLAITEQDKAAEFIDQHPEIQKWYVAGHSMGGVCAASYAEAHQEQVDGLILLGAYPASSTDLADNSQKVLSLYAENDGLTTLDDIERSRENLPVTTEFIEIKGGNHAQFGMYGTQKKDGEATIDALEQQREMISCTLQFLE